MACQFEKCERVPLSGGDGLCVKHDRVVTHEGLRFKRIEFSCMREAFIPDGPFALRLDGHGFSKVIKKYNFKWPFDARLSQIMSEVTQQLAQHFGAQLAYTMSDEITLVFTRPHLYGRRAFKYISMVAGLCTGLFYQALVHVIKVTSSGLASIPPHFDCRWFSLPLGEIPRMLQWRLGAELKNSCANAAYACFEKDELHLLKGLTTRQMNQKAIVLKGLVHSWDFYPDAYKYGIVWYKEEKHVCKPPLVKVINGVTRTFERKAMRRVWTSRSFDFRKVDLMTTVGLKK